MYDITDADLIELNNQVAQALGRLHEDDGKNDGKVLVRAEVLQALLANQCECTPVED